MTAAIDLAGRRFGRLVAVSREGASARGQAIWRWACDCGREKLILATNVVRGLTTSCGCIQSETRYKHGHWGDQAYMAWQGMKARVAGNSPQARKYYCNVQISDRWLNSFAAFLEDMGPCPPGMTLERKNNLGHYEPGNCEWASRKTQSSNTRRTRFVLVGGDRMCLADACRLIGLNYRTAMRRISRGESAQEALRIA